MAGALDMQTIARGLNRVDSVARERVAAGRALTDVSRYGYEQLTELSRFTDVYNPRAARVRLDSIRGRIEALYPSATALDDAPPTATWPALRQAITDAYLEIAGIDAAAGHIGGLSISDDFLAALEELPDRIARGLGFLGKGAGKLLGGVLSEAWVVVLLAAVIVFAYVRLSG